MNQNEYFLHAKINELQTRLALAESNILAIHNQLGANPSLKTSIPLAPLDNRRNQSAPRTTLQHTVPSEQEPPMPLSEILLRDETVYFSIIKGKDANGKFIHSKLEAVYNGTEMLVLKCDDIPSLQGTSSAKPGEILYKFMFALKEANIITRTFQALPWRLCSVVRDGQELTLAQLRRDKQEQ
jgi:hypothetical protein